jgi:hypothetical protein
LAAAGGKPDGQGRDQSQSSAHAATCPLHSLDSLRECAQKMAKSPLAALAGMPAPIARVPKARLRLTIAVEKVEARMGKMLRCRNRVHKPD